MCFNITMYLYKTVAEMTMAMDVDEVDEVDNNSMLDENEGIEETQVVDEALTPEEGQFPAAITWNSALNVLQ